ncbi:MAG: hypothetical protein RSF40_04600 [Oscillospiraceae bacterium]
MLFKFVTLCVADRNVLLRNNSRSITKQIGFSIWQKTFNDRIIRSEQGYQEVWQYIDENPLGQNGGR